jgi:hypothetical protein
MVASQKLASLGSSAAANVNLDLHGDILLSRSFMVAPQKKLASLGGSANVNLDLHGDTLLSRSFMVAPQKN